MNNREIGRLGEDIAEKYLIEHGAVILDRNFYFKGGEIDIICKDFRFNEEYLCFVEVKNRRDISQGYPEEAVDLAKQRKIIKGAKTYLNYKKISYNTPICFDVISILPTEVKWIKNAFQE